MSEFERERAGDRIRSRKATRKAAGLQIAHEAKYGWRFVPTGELNRKGRPAMRVEPEPAEQTVVRRIIGMREQGRGPQYIANLLQREGVPTRRGGRWSKETVKTIVKEGRARLAKGKAAVADVVERPNNTIEGGK